MPGGGAKQKEYLFIAIYKKERLNAGGKKRRAAAIIEKRRRGKVYSG